MEDGRTPVSTREEGGGRREAGEGSSYAKEVGWLSSVCQACEGGWLSSVKRCAIQCTYRPMPECAKKSSIKRSPVHDHWPSCRHRRADRDGIINEQEKRERWGEGRGGGGQGERGSNVSASRERMNRPTFSPLHTLPYTQAPCRCRCSAGNVQAGGRRQAAN